MINRYSHEKVFKIWTDHHRFQTWFDIELAVCKAYEELKIIPKETSVVIKKIAKINLERIYTLEAQTKHEVVAFVNSIVEQINENGAYFHYGITSSDIMDTAFSKMLNEAGLLILEELDLLMSVVKEKAFLYKNLLCVGRTHGIHAEPMSFGLKFVSYYDELLRHRVRLVQRLSDTNICIISGAVGTYSLVEPEVEKLTAKFLNMNTHKISSQIVTRDVYADLFNLFALIGGCVERISLELRNLQRTELNELTEGFSDGQTGSSAMPHKRNPISAENLTGCARILRGYAGMSLENQALWHERDISHSSVERVVASDSTILLAYMLKRLSGVLKNININEVAVKKNLELTNGLIFSSFVLSALMEKGLKRDEAYKLVQKNAKILWVDGSKHFCDILKKDPEILKYLDLNKIDELFKTPNTKNTDLIYKKVFN